MSGGLTEILLGRGPFRADTYPEPYRPFPYHRAYPAGNSTSSRSAYLERNRETYRLIPEQAMPMVLPLGQLSPLDKDQLVTKLEQLN